MRLLYYRNHLELFQKKGMKVNAIYTSVLREDWTRFYDINGILEAFTFSFDAVWVEQARIFAKQLV